VSVPNAPSVCSRGLHYPAAALAPTAAYTTHNGDKVFAPPSHAAPDLAGGVLPCLCLAVGGSAPDYLQSEWLVFGRKGEVVTHAGHRRHDLGETGGATCGALGPRRPDNLGTIE
jgi:hypothetical protein